MEMVTVSLHELQEKPFLPCCCGAILARRRVHPSGHQTLHPVSLVSFSFQLTPPYETVGECRRCGKHYRLSLPGALGVGSTPF